MLSRGQKIAFAIGIVIWAASWVLIIGRYAGWLKGTPLDVPFFATVGFSTGLLALLTFGSFYVSKDTPVDTAIRTSIAASLVIFYVVLVTDLLVVPGFIGALGTGTAATADTQAAASFGQSIFTGLSGFVGIVLAFYFAAGAVEKAAEHVKDAVTTRAATAADAQKEVATIAAEAQKHVADQTLAAAHVQSGPPPNSQGN
jgi:hypothetical protein